MSEENKVPPEETPAGQKADTSWQEVGQQFQVLGQSLAQAVRTAWENEETQRRVEEMRIGLQSMAQEIGKAIDDTASSPQGQKIRQNAEHAAESLRVASEQTVQEVRPQLLSALEQVNNELQKLINRLQNPPTPPTPPPSTPENPPSE